MPHVEVEGAALYYEIDGPGEGRAPSVPTIVFAHGGEGTHRHWWQQVAALAPRHRCVTYDARGFGRSTAVASPHGTAAHRRDLLGLLDALGIDRAVLVGQSMGGWAVSGMAQHHPERVLGIVMADTPFGFFTPALAAWAGTMIAKLGDGFDVIAACLSPGFRARQPELTFLFEALGRLNPPRQGPRGLDAYREMQATPPGDYSALGVPACFVVGADDELTVPWLIEATAAAVGGSELHVVADAGHSVYFEQPTRFNEIVAGFVSAQFKGLS